ncbi:MAG: OmpA-like transmembrane domain-containing protein, partial [Halothiobacillaceae bacterium]
MSVFFCRMAASSNSGGSLSYDWSATDNVLIDTDSANGTFTVDPSILNSGYYGLRVVVSDGATSSTAELLLKVVAVPPNLTAADNDSDGVNDTDEGFGDSDGDGIVNYRDNATLASNVVPGSAATINGYLVESEPGLLLGVGQVAFRSEGAGAGVTLADITAHANQGVGVVMDAATYVYSAGGFDVTVSGLPVAGQSARVVVAQSSVTPSAAVYRIPLTSGAGWQDFVVDANNRVASAPGAPGFCPPPGDKSYTTGITAGHWCIELTLADGGPNDVDGVVNQTLASVGGVAQQLPPTGGGSSGNNPTPRETLTGSGSGGGGGAMEVWGMGALMGLLIWRRRVTRASVPLLVTLGLLPMAAQATSAYLPDSMGLSYLWVQSGDRNADFNSDLRMLGTGEARVSQSDLDRGGWTASVGYGLPKNMRLAVAYVDLGDVATRIRGPKEDVNSFIDSAANVYPVTAAGWTFSL